MNATDKELLEMAARAIGLKVEWVMRTPVLGSESDPYLSKDSLVGQRWNPLARDGDALRLAVVLGLDIQTSDEQYVFAGRNMEENGLGYCECHGDDSLLSVRRAIVRAAAEIGKSMTKESDHEH